MRTSAIVTIGVGAFALGALGCAESQGPDAAGANIRVTVAPLDLPLMTDACYGLSVFNTANIPDMNQDSLVWTQPSLCASDYGAEGGIRFTGICDAQAGGFDENGSALDVDHNNTVMLVLNDIYTGGDWDGDGVALSADEDYINPCPEEEFGQDNGCILNVPCTANQDKKVLFNLTVMRDAQIGFFDMVVKFHDVFCAAKLDCVDDHNSTLTYLHDAGANPPGDGPTVVLGFSCLGGDGGDISMYLDNLEITCATGSGDTYTVTRTASIDPSGGPGNLSAPDLTQTGSPEVLFGAAVNTGEGFQGAQFWNVLIGIDLPGLPDETCTLHTTGTVAEGGFEVDSTTPALTRYPFIDWTVDLTEDGNRSCTRHPLNGPDGGVETVYTPLESPETFDHELTFEAACPCWQTNDLRAEAAAITDDGVFVIGRIVSDVSTIFQIQTESLGLFAGAGQDEALGCCIGPDNENLECIWDLSQEQVDACLIGVNLVVADSCQDAGECALGCQSAAPGAAQCLECIYDESCQVNQHCDRTTFSCVADAP